MCTLPADYIENENITFKFLYESLTNMLELKDFRFSLWQVVTAM